MSDFYSNMYNPDVLTCLANLSNDEVFTPPEVANRMLDMLPEELWHNSNATFLDPACKSGVFLREIAKRLIEGLKEEIPDLQERINHIFHKQLYEMCIRDRCVRVLFYLMLAEEIPTVVGTPLPNVKNCLQIYTGKPGILPDSRPAIP